MIASDWVAVASVVVGDQGALVGRADLPVPPDPGGQGEQPLRHPHGTPAGSRPTDTSCRCCPVSPNLAREHVADLRRARFAETAASWLSH